MKHIDEYTAMTTFIKEKYPEDYKYLFGYSREAVCQERIIEKEAYQTFLDWLEENQIEIE